MLVDFLVYNDRDGKKRFRYSFTGCGGKQYQRTVGPFEEEDVLNAISAAIAEAEVVGH